MLLKLFEGNTRDGLDTIHIQSIQFNQHEASSSVSNNNIPSYIFISPNRDSSLPYWPVYRTVYCDHDTPAPNVDKKYDECSFVLSAASHGSSERRFLI